MKQLTTQEVSDMLGRGAAGEVVYLIGAAGCGMSVLGHLLLDLGLNVKGSDLHTNDEVRELLLRGAQIHQGHAAEQFRRAQPWLVVYSSAIRLDNPELQAARELKVPIVRRAVLLAALARRQRSLCVAGMHGKTTTSALLAYALEQLGEAPSYAIGAPVPQLKPPARFQGATFGAPRSWFVVETDESDGTLAEFAPEIAVVLNVDEEHLDFYENLEAICGEFQRFAAKARERLIFCADDARLTELFARHPLAVSYGFHPLAAYRIEWSPDRAAETNSFEVWHRGRSLGTFGVRLVGEKNISNAGAVVAVLHQLGFEPAAIAQAIESFTGAARRQEELFHDERFRVLDDYGHHPSEIRPTLQALRRLGSRRLLVAFQPHRYTRTKELLDRFAGCFAGADHVWITDIYAAGERPIAGVDGEHLAAEIRARGQAVDFVADVNELPGAVRRAMLPGDLMLFCGAGSITKAAHQLAALLCEETMAGGDKLFSDLSARLSRNSVVRQNEPLAKRTTLRVGGQADLYTEPASESDLARVMEFCAEHKVPFVILGRGSNLLIKDGGVRGVVICLANPWFSRVTVAGDRIHCGAGAKLKAVAVESRRHSLAGLEFLEGIPGSVGGALRMNAGAMGSWMFDVVETIRFMDFAGGIHERVASEINVEYRGCPMFKTHIAVGTVLKGLLTDPEAIAERMKTFSQKRWDSQPAQPSAGCIFKNPPTIPAGKLIDELGMKGTRVGAAVVSDVHGNFIVNEGGATARDVLALIEMIRRRARAERGIELETEVEIIGEPG